MKERETMWNVIFWLTFWAILGSKSETLPLVLCLPAMGVIFEIIVHFFKPRNTK